MSTQNRSVWFSKRGLACAAVLTAGVLLAGSVVAAPVPDGAAAGNKVVGQEAKSLENQARDAQAPVAKPDPAAAKKMEEAVKGATKAPAAPVVPEPIEKDAFKVNRLEVRGDVDLLKKKNLLEPLRSKLEGKMLTSQKIQTIAQEYKKFLVETRKFYLAEVVLLPPDAATGVVIVEVDLGRIGKISLYKGGGVKGQKLPYTGRYFSASQLRRRLANLEPEAAFDYNEFYRAVFGINTHPDLIMDTDLRVRSQETPAGVRRYADMDFYVREKIPIHAILSVANSGTEVTGDWRPSLTLQHLNLTKHDDVLTLNAGPISTDGESLKSGAGSYYLPYYSGLGGAFTLYGGYSDLDAEDVVPGIDLKGSGWFTGLQGSRRIISNSRHAVSLSLGVVYRELEEQLILTGFGGNDDQQPQEIQLLPFVFGVSYSSASPDGLGGRNFLTSETSANFEGLVTDQEDIQAVRGAAEATYVIERLQLARLQPVSFSRTEKPGQWLVFAKLDGQLAGCALIPAEQKALGGMDNVRGFAERIVQGDDGVSGTLELRTPLFTDLLSSPFRSAADVAKGRKEGKSIDRLQFVGFVDGGHVQLQDAQDQVDSYTLLSAGVGFRLQVTRFSQMKLDYGVPLSYDDSLDQGSGDTVDKAGRVHVSAQLQF